MKNETFGSFSDVDSFQMSLAEARHRHMLALALENPSSEMLQSRLAMAYALQEQLRALLAFAVDKKIESDRFGDLALRLLQEMPDAIASKAARDRAASRYAKDPKQESKRLVRECWENWQQHPSAYQNQTKFANDMMDKFGVEVGGNLESVATITNKWIPEFKREARVKG